MAILSRSKSLLFVMAPRTGCTAIGALMQQEWGAERLPPDSILHPNGSIALGWKHNTVPELVDAGLIARADLDEWTVFTTVRNPFDSLVSLYIKQRETYQPLLEEPGSWVNRKPRYRRQVERASRMSFPEWVRANDRPRHPVKRARNLLGGGATPAHMYGRYLEGADVVLRFEHLQEDFSTMLDRLGIPDLEIPTVNRTAEREGRSYRDFYDESTRRYVARRYASDLERFGYSF